MTRRPLSALILFESGAFRFFARSVFLTQIAEGQE